MLFPTFTFAVFFLVVLALHGILRWRPGAWQAAMLAASFVFYGWWDWRFCFLLGGSGLANWFFGARIAVARDARFGRNPAARWWVRIAVSANLGLLGVFKYYGFFVDTLGDAFGIEPGLALRIVLPVGISFFTFQAISYVVDIGRGDLDPAPLPDVMLYLAFFPQLVAGPIVRATDFLPELADRRRQGGHDGAAPLGTAFWLIGAGLFKKVVVSSYLAEAAVDGVFAAPATANGVDRALAVYAYAIQIYADFSGYTDIAIGCALLLGFRFPQNFDSPYQAVSMQDFWRRWHISLSTWLRDYLYIPLGGNRGGALLTHRNLALTMVLGGLWHGASWNFVVWGAIHGGALALERMLRRERSPRRSVAELSILGGAARWLLTFHVVCLAWVFFRAPTLGDAWTFLTSFERAAALPTTAPLVAGVVAVALLLQGTPPELTRRVRREVDRLGPTPIALAGGAWIVLVVALAPAGVAPFIYFQF